MKLPAVEFSPDSVVIDRKWVWKKRPFTQDYVMFTPIEGNTHYKDWGDMAQYIRDLLSNPSRKGFIKEGTLNIVMRTPKKKRPKKKDEILEVSASDCHIIIPGSFSSTGGLE